MIIAGLGSRRGVNVDEVLEAVRAAADCYGVAVAEIGRLATGEKKASEPALAEAALRLGIPLEIMADIALAQTQDRTLTHSGHSVIETGLPSLSETAALAAAGSTSRLLGPRVVVGPVTCALAKAGDA